MQLRSALQIQTIVRAMTDVVLPATDPSNKLALEQGQLIVGMLNLMALQLPLQFRFDCDELSRLLAFSDELRRRGKGEGGIMAALSELADATRVGADVLERARAEPHEVVDAVRLLRGTSSAAVQAVFADGDAATQAAIQEAVLRMSEEQILRDRSWVITQGWEPDPKSIPQIESLLAPVKR